MTSLKTLLELEGHAVFTAKTPQAIRSVLQEKGIELILLDVYLQVDGREISGYQILDTIRRQPAWEDICVLMTSGEDLRDQAYQAGADAFLLKPYTPDVLVDLIQSQLREADL